MAHWMKSTSRKYPRSCQVITILVIIMITLQAFYPMTNHTTARVITLRENKNQLIDSCAHVHIAVPANGVYQRQRLPILIKSVLLYSRHVILHLHMITDYVNEKRIQILLSTWNLPQVVPHFYHYENDKFLVDPNSLVEIAGYFIRNKDALAGVNKMILTKSDVYFTGDVSVLWDNMEAILQQQVIGILESQPNNPEKSASDGVLLLNLKQASHLLATLNPPCHNALLLFTNIRTNSNVNKGEISVICQQTTGKKEKQYAKHAYVIPRITTELHLYINAVRRNPSYDITMLTESFNGDSFRELIPSCVSRDPPVVIKDVCDVYPSIALMPRRTHVSFISNVRENIKYSPTDVTLVTQLMINRIESLERLLESWKGPSQVALYLTDDELVSFIKLYDQSDILKKAKATYHVIFKRHVYYPINYVRNVAIRETRTPFYVMIDVDFAAQSTLYQSIVRHIKQLKPNEKKVFIIPVFETPYKIYTLPTSKEQLLKDLDSNLLIPYHQFSGTWTRGHRATDYDKWKKSNNTYEIQWEFGFEPYLVVPTSEFLYDETLVERMRDKLVYTVNIVINGYSMHVLPSDFLIHTPHRKSASHTYSDHTFLKCSGDIYVKRIKELISQVKKNNGNVPPFNFFRI